MSILSNMGADRSQIYCNVRVKHFPQGLRQVSAFSADILRRPGWEAQQPRAREAKPDGGKSADSVARSKRRARAAVSDIALSNEFCYFVTLTLDKERVDRYDEKEVVRKLNNWLDNCVRRKGLAYVLVPERHKDGAIHMHGFFNDALRVVDSGTLSTGSGKPRKPRSARQRKQWLEQGAHVVFNLPEWRLGFSTAIALYGSRRAAVGYVCKYITKSEDKVGGRWYYSGGDLSRPEVTYHEADFATLVSLTGAEPYSIEGLCCYGITFYEEGQHAAVGND